MNKLKQLRESKGMSQSEFARACGVNIRGVQDYELGRSLIKNASVERVYRMAKVLGVSIEELAELE